MSAITGVLQMHIDATFFQLRFATSAAPYFKRSNIITVTFQHFMRMSESITSRRNGKDKAEDETSKEDTRRSLKSILDSLEESQRTVAALDIGQAFGMCPNQAIRLVLTPKIRTSQL